MQEDNRNAPDLQYTDCTDKTFPDVVGGQVAHSLS